MNIPKLINLSKVYENKAKNGKPYLKIMDGKESYSCWDATLFKMFKEGVALKCLIEPNGSFQNIVDVVSEDVAVVPAYDDEPRAAYPEKTPKNEVIELLTKIHNLIKDIHDNQLPPM